MTARAVTPSPEDLAREARARALALAGAPAVPELLGMLSDPSWIVRRAVVAALAAAGDAAVKPLCELVAEHREDENRLAAAVDTLSASVADVLPDMDRLSRHHNPAAVGDAAQILGRRRDERAVALLEKLLRHPNDNVAVSAIEALGRIGGRAAVASLIAAVEDSNFFRTFPAIDVLGRIGDPRAVEPLSGLLLDPRYAPEAARALGRTGERAAVRPLGELLQSGSDAMVRVVALSLSELDERFTERGARAGTLEALLREAVPRAAPRRLTQALSGADVAEGTAICRLLGTIGSEETDSVLRAQLDGPPAVAHAAGEALRQRGRASEDQLAGALREGSSARRKVILPLVRQSSAAGDVALCLEDPDPEVRAMACEALARLGNPEVLRPLFERLSDTNLRVIQSAIAAIQSLGTSEARQLALEAARSESPVVRRSALRILGYFGHAAALGPFLEALKDPDSRVRDAALQGLPYLEDKRALDALFAAARDGSEHMRATAMRSLGQCANLDPRIAAYLLKGLSDPEPWVRYYAAQSLGRLAFDAAAGPLAQRLSDDAGQVRVAAVEALAHLSSEEAHASLRKAAQSEEPDVRRAALIGIGLRAQGDDLPLLCSALEAGDTATRLVALSALSTFASPAVLSALTRAAADPDEQVRIAAIGFLAGRPEQEATEILVDLLAAEVSRDRAQAALAVPTTGRVPGLLAALELASDDFAPRLTSVLARLGEPEATAALFSAMKMENAAARKAAAGTLAALRTPDALSALKAAAESDPSAEVRSICSLLLAQ